MPRMSESKKQENQLYITESGRTANNQKCNRCIHDCKQSYKVEILRCPKFQDKRIKKVI